MEAHRISGPTRVPDITAEPPSASTPIPIKPIDAVHPEKVIQWSDFLFPILKLIAGLVIIYFGITSTGGMFVTSSPGDTGYFVVRYVWQIGNLLQIVGSIIVYHFLIELVRVYYAYRKRD